ncbi:PREDICTED: uncharacterized protein LOC108694703 [Atta colombica]|uniref:uncharacterized protein LOC108694703 n=1 Tax=Atta colombica TaxID=520822 RepID=UPI00084C5452|nr:PREDICTED: uncharacterized protein LOC108694703 [Atta colombica]
MTKSLPTEIVKPKQIYYIPLFYMTAVQPPAYEWSATLHTAHQTSLNDHMLIGPKLKRDLATVLMQWRQYHYVFTADIAKMYRQILVDSRDTDYQRIVWQPILGGPITDYRLFTVTYSTAASYLALRVLEQLIDEGAEFPLAILVLRHQIYIDDCAFGADQIEFLFKRAIN